MSTNNSYADHKSQMSELEAVDQSIVEINDVELEMVAGGGDGLEHQWNSTVRSERYINHSVDNTVNGAKKAGGW